MGQPEGRAKIFAQLQPMLFGYGHENFHYFRIELRSRAALDFSPGVRKRQRFAIRAVADHGVEGIRNRKDARPEWYVVTFQASRVARAVKKFLVRQHDLRGVAQKRNAD